MSQIEVRILQQEYVLTCPAGKEDALRAAVSRVDADMERIRSTGKIRARERVGVLAAVNLAFENTELQAENEAMALGFMQAQQASTPSEQDLAPAEPDAAEATDFLEQPASPSDAPAISEEVLAMMAELEALLALREQELLEAKALIERLESALDIDDKLL